MVKMLDKLMQKFPLNKQNGMYNNFVKNMTK